MRVFVRTFVLCCLNVAGSLILGVLSSRAQKKAAIPFPAGYRHWTHVKTMAIYGNQHPLFNQFGGLHNVYVNDLGVASLKQGMAYPDGTVFVFDLFDIRSAQGTIETRGQEIRRRDEKERQAQCLNR